MTANVTDPLQRNFMNTMAKNCGNQEHQMKLQNNKDEKTQAKHSPVLQMCLLGKRKNEG